MEKTLKMCPVCAGDRIFHDSACGACGWDPDKLNRRESFDRGHDQGNYGAAYESDWDSWMAKERRKVRDLEEEIDSASYWNGAICGFYSSYELSEIPDEDCRFTVDILRKAWDLND